MRQTVIACAVLGTMWMVGCEKKEEAPANPTAAAAKSDTKVAEKDMQKAAKDTGAAVTAGEQATADAAKKEAAKAPTTAPSAAPTVSAADADAQAKYQQVMDYIKDNKLDLADKALTDLEKNKATLPAQIAGELPTARSALDAAKAKGAAGGVKLPGQ